MVRLSEALTNTGVVLHEIELIPLMSEARALEALVTVRKADTGSALINISAARYLDGLRHEEQHIPFGLRPVFDNLQNLGIVTRACKRGLWVQDVDKYDDLYFVSPSHDSGYSVMRQTYHRGSDYDLAAVVATVKPRHWLVSWMMPRQYVLLGNQAALVETLK